MGLIARDPHKADIAQHGHMAKPREATWTTRTHTWRWDSGGLIGVWVHGYSGPTKADMGVLRLSGRRESLRRFPLLYSTFLLSFLHVGLTALSSFARHVAEHGALDRFALINVR